MLRTAQALLEAKVPPGASAARSSPCAATCPTRCRCRAWPSARSATASSCARAARWQAESGQYVLEFDVSVQNGVLHVVEHKEAAPAAAAAAPRDWFTQALALESTDVNAALAAYGEAVAADPGNVAAWTNLGQAAA